MKKKWLALSAMALCLATGSALAKDIKEIRFGVDTTYPPFEYKAPDGSFAGFDVELGNAICEKLAVKCRWIVSDFDGLIPGLRARKFDGILSSLTVTPARAEQIDFTDRMWSGPTSMVVKEGANLEPTPESLKGKTVGVQQGTIQESFAKAKLAPAGVNVQSYQDQDQVYADLISGRVDVAMQDMLQAEEGFMKSPQAKGFVNKTIHDELLPADTAIGVRKGNDEMRTLLNKGIAAIHADGTYEKIQKKYFGDLDLYNTK
ncbi:histidine transport system substrate-binding protein [Pseudomonas duriflava]|uniref:Histidine transport system substrate-binding protein n=1 Tax=Pseudomonas duriflava TaxID=459528 RepID=A0A562QAH7_9PSED|nr:ABC transporter substrate-binding protein [Pseudomonas duriflava]TWI53026.1 histidine transport system substrate-binding protein [Pseudomonas duriflava]